MDIEIMKHVLEDQLENNNIKRNTKRAQEFEYAFLMGALATYAANNNEPPAYLAIIAMTGRSLFDIAPTSEVMQ
jgi:hypothetical protein